MKLLVFMIFILAIAITPAFAEIDKIIFSDGQEYEFGDITEERKYQMSSITKTQGYTTTGEMFFLFTSPSFEKIMLLDQLGNWKKATLIDRPEEKIEPQNNVITNDKIELNILTDQYERVYNKSDYKFFVKTFDKSIYSGNDFQNFQGKVSGAKVSAIVIDPNGEIKADFEGFVENGLYEGSVFVPENLWQRGWYTVDIVVEFDGDFYSEQLSFYVYGQPASDSSGCPAGTTRDSTGTCV